MWSNWKVFSVVAIGLVCFCGFVFAVGPWRNPHLASGSDRFFFVLFMGDDHTEYAAGYSETGFWSIQLGWNKIQVREAIGEPLVVHGGDTEEYWRFTRAPRDTNYFLRVVTFDRSGKVVSISGEYFVD